VWIVGPFSPSSPSAGNPLRRSSEKLALTGRRQILNYVALLRHERGKESSQVGDDLLDVLLHMR
jgi:hypothetical protein